MSGVLPGVSPIIGAFSNRSHRLFVLMAIIALPGSVQAGDDSRHGAREESRREHYIDDDDARRLADLSFRLIGEARPRLQLEISAIGPDVEPIAGYTGVPGTNRYTAEELEFLVDGVHSVEVISRPADFRDEAAETRGLLAEAEIGPLPERRIGSDGMIDFLAMTHREYLKSVQIDSDAMSGGPVRTEVIVNGRARLRVVWEAVGRELRILELQSLGSDRSFADRGRGILPGRPFDWYRPVVQEADPIEEISDWAERDMEGRWAVMTQMLDRDPTRTGAWMQSLADREHLQLLEWLMLYRRDVFRSYMGGQFIADRDVPQWIRVAAWHSGMQAHFGHGLQTAQQLIQSTDPARAEDWLTRNKESLDNWDEALAGVYQQLRADKYPPENSERLLPALQPKDVLRHLFPPTEVAEMGDRRRAEEGVVYVHQVVRAIDGLVVSSRYTPEFLNQLSTLAEHRHPKIRQAALLAWTFLRTPAREAGQLPKFQTIIDDAEEQSAVREAALTGLSYLDLNYPDLENRLLTVALTEGHPARTAAIARLGDLCTAADLSVLDLITRDTLSADQATLLTKGIASAVSRQAGVSAFVRRIRNAGAARVNSDEAATRAWTEAAENIYRSLPEPKRKEASVGLAVYKTTESWDEAAEEAAAEILTQILEASLAK